MSRANYSGIEARGRRNHSLAQRDDFEIGDGNSLEIKKLFVRLGVRYRLFKKKPTAAKAFKLFNTYAELTHRIDESELTVDRRNKIISWSFHLEEAASLAVEFGIVVKKNFLDSDWEGYETKKFSAGRACGPNRPNGKPRSFYSKRYAAILKDHEKGLTNNELTRKYGVNRSNIGKAILKAKATQKKFS